MYEGGRTWVRTCAQGEVQKFVPFSAVRALAIASMQRSQRGMLCVWLIYCCDLLLLVGPNSICQCVRSVCDVVTYFTRI